MKPPWDVDMRVTWRCNLRCVMCDCWKSGSGLPELTKREVYKVLDEMRGWPVRYFVVTGGEPMLRRDICEIIEYGAAAGVNVCMTTNGILIDRDAAQRLRSSGLHSVDVSIDGARPGTHDAVRGADGCWRKAVAAVENLCEAGGIEVWIASTIMSHNLFEALDLAKLAGSLGVPIKYQPVVVWNGAAETQNANAASSPLWIGRKRWGELDRAVDRLIDFKLRHGAVNNPVSMLERMKEYFRGGFEEDCVRGNSLVLDSNGDVLPCWYWASVGNAAGASMREVWEGAAMAAQWKRMSRCPNRCMLNCHYPADPIDRGFRMKLRQAIRRRLGIKARMEG